ncbi:MAG: hypothetical protein IAE91_10990 [Ignavibacteriaceae bacterium]|nr:hypothetical protein [Ignavibacteriaceae bacterium]
MQESPEAKNHIDTFFAQTRQNHFRLTTITDTKSHILIVVSFFTLNITVAFFDNPVIKPAAIVLFLQAIFTLFFASISLMPNYKKIKITKEEADKKQFLDSSFAGSYIHYDFETFKRLMTNTIYNPAKIYDVQMKEIYDSGKILIEKKFKYLNIAFLIFISGSAISVILLILNIFFNEGNITLKN